MAAKSDKHPLVGVWRLISCEHRLATGETRLPFGSKPAGRLVYTADGYMIAILADPRRPLARSAQLFEATDSELARSARGCVAYTGRWRVRAGQVIHRVDNSLFPNWIGSAQMRRIERKGRRLILSTNAFRIFGVEQTARLVWEKAS